MWTPLYFCLIIVAVATASDNSPWKPNTQYQYAVRGRTLTALHQVANQYSGIAIKASVSVQQKSDDIISVKVNAAQYSNIHANLSRGWSSPIPDSQLHYQQIPVSNSPFELKYKHGVIVRMIASKNIPVWELNFLKSIATQLQVDTQAENLQKSRINNLPSRESVNGVYKTMEDSVAGECETLYDISPLPPVVLVNKPQLAPLAYNNHGNNNQGNNDNQLIDIVKTRNFSNCDVQSDYHFGITGITNLNPASNQMGTFLSRSSVSRVVISGNLQKYTIQSSVTTNKIIASPFLFDKQNGMVVSRMNLTLVDVKSSSGSPQSPPNPQTIQNLVYEYNPASPDENTQRPAAYKSISDDDDDDDSSSSSSDSSSISSSSSSDESDRRNRNNGRNSNNQNRNRRSVAQGPSQQSSSSSSDGDSSSCDDNSIWDPDNSEEQIWQTKPKLTQAPNMPFLPFFIANQGNSIQSAKDFQAVPAVKAVAQQIANDIMNPSAIPGQKTLQKFIVLKQILQTMNSKQMEEASKDLYVQLSRESSKDTSKSSSDSKKYHAWTALRDAMAHAGTGPALLTLKEWILSKKVEGNEAAELISILPNTAQYPDVEYMNAFFDLATSPHVQSQPFLGHTAILSVTELARKAFINNGTAYRRFPVHVFGPLKPKREQPVVQRYIPYLSQSLKQAVSQANSSNIRTTILALGNLAHPGILKVFEPYLEGKQPMTHFQRLTIVTSMSKLAKTYPKVARPVLFRIYQNTGEATEVRAAAVFQIMKTNPPAQLLQRMAQFTNDDLDMQVISAVKSAIETAAYNMNNPEQELQENSQSAVNLLNPKVMPMHFSKKYLQAFSVRKMNRAYKQSLSYIGSEDGFVPSNIFYSLRQTWGGYKKQYTGFDAMSSSFNDLLSILDNQFNYSDLNSAAQNQDDANGQQSQNSPSPPEQALLRNYDAISRILHISPREQAQVEASLQMTTLDGKRFFTIDNHTIESIPKVVRDVASSLRAGRSFNYTKLTDKMAMTVSFPTAMGLPFTFSFHTPTLLYIGGEASLKSHPDLAQGQGYVVNVPHTVNASIDLHFVYSSRTQSEMGFMTPFNRNHYLSGVSKNIQFNIPVHADFDVDLDNNKIVSKIRPLDQLNKQNVFEYSTEPFTNQVDLVKFALSNGQQGHDSNSNLKIVHVRQPNQIHKTVGHDSTGMAFDFDYHSEQKFLDFASIYNEARKHDPISAFVYAWAEDSINLNNITLAYNPQISTAKEARFSATYLKDSDDTDYNCLKSHRMRHNNQQSGSSDPTKASPNDKISASLAYPSSSSPDSQSRQQFFLEKAGKGIQSSDSAMLDLSAEFLGQTKAYYVATVVVAHSNVSDKSRLLFFAEKNPAQTTPNNKKGQLCAAVESSMPNVPMMDYYKALEADPTSYFNAEVEFGDKCSSQSASKVQFKAKMEQSHDRRGYVEGLPLSQLCKQQISQGNTMQYSCRNMTTQANLLDKYKMLVNFEKVPDSVKNATYKAYAALRYAFRQYASEDFISNKNTHNKIEVEARLAPDLRSANISMDTPLLRAEFNNLRLNRYIAPLVALHPDYSPTDLLARQVFRNLHYPSCVVDNNMAETFDNTTYPIKLGKCWHAMFHYTPKYDGEYQSNIQFMSTGGFDKEISVLVRDTSNPNQKELLVAINDNQVIVEPPCGNNEAAVKINGQEVSIYNDSISSFDDEMSGETFIQIYILPDGAVRLYAPKQEIEIHYDGNAIKLKAPSNYRSSIRGLCGTYNTQPADDFTTPQGCVLKDPFEFAATYAMDDSACEGPAKEYKRKAQNSINKGHCYYNTVLYGNVVTDQESFIRPSVNFIPGSNSILPATENSKVQMADYKNNDNDCSSKSILYEYRNEYDCFSEPGRFEQCANGCIASRSKRDKFKCMEPSALTQHWKDMIARGDTPNTSKGKVLRTYDKKYPKRASANTMSNNNAAVNEGSCPWRSATSVYDTRGVIGLHQEIEQFYEYMSATKEEQQMRFGVINNITNVIHKMWPKAEVKLFGSFATGLYLPTSDVDLTVVGSWIRSPLHAVKNALIDAKICNAEKIKVIESATVPIVKLTEQHFNVQVDISFNKYCVVKSVPLVKAFRKTYPELDKLVLVIKHYLMLRDLNEVYTGGISSYCLVLMTVSFLQMHPRYAVQDQNLGVLLLKFFELYGKKFNYPEIAIRVTDGGSYVVRGDIEKNVTGYHPPPLIFIENPLIPGENLALGAFRALEVKQAFEYAYLTLKNAIKPGNRFMSDANVISILGRIVRVDDDVISHRIPTRRTIQ